ncbi:hypothetical protein FOA52_011333 [Chlamydomonas sp. UWO 241]|nr:hypothetical protein FOA52_011333 [Chlamydomonas sp. UWO 241]
MSFTLPPGGAYADCGAPTQAGLIAQINTTLHTEPVLDGILQAGGVSTTCSDLSASGRRRSLLSAACGEAVNLTTTIEVTSPNGTQIAALRAALHALLAGPGSGSPSVLGACTSTVWALNGGGWLTSETLLMYLSKNLAPETVVVGSCANAWATNITASLTTALSSYGSTTLTSCTTPEALTDRSAIVIVIASPPPPGAAAAAPDNGGIGIGVIIGAALGGLLALLICCCLLFFCIAWRRRKRSTKEMEDGPVNAESTAAANDNPVFDGAAARYAMPADDAPAAASHTPGPSGARGSGGGGGDGGDARECSDVLVLSMQPKVQQLPTLSSMEMLAEIMGGTAGAAAGMREGMRRSPELRDGDGDVDGGGADPRPVLGRSPSKQVRSSLSHGRSLAATSKLNPSRSWLRFQLAFDPDEVSEGAEVGTGTRSSPAGRRWADRTDAQKSGDKWADAGPAAGGGSSGQCPSGAHPWPAGGAGDDGPPPRVSLLGGLTSMLSIRSRAARGTDLGFERRGSMPGNASSPEHRPYASTAPSTPLKTRPQLGASLSGAAIAPEPGTSAPMPTTAFEGRWADATQRASRAGTPLDGDTSAIAPGPGTSAPMPTTAFGGRWADAIQRTSRAGTPLDGGAPVGAAGTAHFPDDYRTSRGMADMGAGGVSTRPGVRDMVVMSAAAAYEQQRSMVASYGGTWAHARPSASGTEAPHGGSPMRAFPHLHAQPVRQSHSGIGSGGHPSSPSLHRSRVGTLADSGKPAGFRGSDPGAVGGRGPIELGNLDPLVRWTNKHMSQLPRVNSGELVLAEGGAYAQRKSAFGDVDGGGLSTPIKVAFERGLRGGRSESGKLSSMKVRSTSTKGALERGVSMAGGEWLPGDGNGSGGSKSSPQFAKVTPGSDDTSWLHNSTAETALPSRWTG